MNPIKEIKYFFRNLKYRVKMLYIFNKYLYASWEYTTTVLEINFSMFVDFYENGGLGDINWESDDEHIHARKEMQELYFYLFWRLLSVTFCTLDMRKNRLKKLS